MTRAAIVRDHIPLEQGLRHFEYTMQYILIFVRDHIPLEQGLRHKDQLLQVLCQNVRDHIPLEQGLRRAGQGSRGDQGQSETIFH